MYETRLNRNNGVLCFVVGGRGCGFELWNTVGLAKAVKLSTLPIPNQLHLVFLITSLTHSTCKFTVNNGESIN